MPDVSSELKAWHSPRCSLAHRNCATAARSNTHQPRLRAKMRWLLSYLALALVGACQVCQAVSSTGNRLLIVLEEAAEKDNYSQFWKDLEGEHRLWRLRSIGFNWIWMALSSLTGRGFKLSFESPKNDQLMLFRHGARAYDHLMLLPPKSKGQLRSGIMSFSHLTLCLRLWARIVPKSSP